MKRMMMAFAAVSVLLLNLGAQDASKKSTAEAPPKQHTKAKTTAAPAISITAAPSPPLIAARGVPGGIKKNAYTPAEMQWGDGPPFIPAGAKMSVLDGNPMGDEIYTLRLKMPDGYKVGAHWHPKREEVTIISGNLQIGMGEKFDAAKVKGYPQGSFFYMDPEMHHFAQAKGATEIQIHGRGPVKFNYIDPNDDPSNKKK